VLRVPEARAPSSLLKSMRKTELEIRTDTAFVDVMKGCAQSKRPGQGGTWITPPMIRGYHALHELGVAHSIEAWSGTTLVGGLYGISFGTYFCGESMFARVDDASKIAFATLLVQLHTWGFSMVDCQTHSEHLQRFGATLWRRENYLAELGALVAQPTRMGPWVMNATPLQAAEILRARRDS
jgi:leucyl/phenylalanyl-tRNA---protein transferase